MIDFEELARKRKEEDDRLDSMALWQLQDKYKMTKFYGGNVDSQIGQDLLNRQDYYTQEKIRGLKIVAALAKGDVEAQKNIYSNIDALLLGTPKKKK